MIRYLAMSTEYQPRGGLILSDESLSICYGILGSEGLPQTVRQMHQHLARENPLLKMISTKCAMIISNVGAERSPLSADSIDRAFRLGTYLGYFGLLIQSGYELPEVTERPIIQALDRMDQIEPPKDRIWQAMTDDYDRNLSELIDTATDQSPVKALESFITSGAGCVSYFLDHQIAYEIQAANAHLS